jgi:hypothetical protein
MRVTISLLVLSLTLAGGCRKEPAAAASSGSVTAPAAVPAAQLTPEQLGELGGRIKKSPADAPRLLAEHGLTDESFEAAIRQVTESPDASKRYAAAFRAVK